VNRELVTDLTRHLRRGNKKLPKSTLIFNPGGAAADCASRALGLCRVAHICYARKAERQYWRTVLPFRRRQRALWQACTATEFSEAVLRKTARARTSVTALRLSEAADFEGQKDVEKAEQVSERLHTEGLAAYCYTARSDLDFSACGHLVVNGSTFLPNALHSNCFTASAHPTGIVCPGDCRGCDLCVWGKGRRIAVKYH
jgi:hypothetical protein